MYAAYFKRSSDPLSAAGARRFLLHLETNRNGVFHIFHQVFNIWYKSVRFSTIYSFFVRSWQGFPQEGCAVLSSH